MSKLSATIRYSCTTALQSIPILYAVEFSMVALAILYSYYVTRDMNQVFVAGLEAWAMIFVFIYGISSFLTEFPYFLQNGFTRRTIYQTMVVEFVVVAATMALVDTLASIVLQRLSEGYYSLFMMVYGDGHAAIFHWAWLFFLYLVIICWACFGTVSFYRFGKLRPIIAWLVFFGFLLVVAPTLANVLVADDQRHALLHLLYSLIGFSDNGDVHFLRAYASGAVLAALASGGTYAILRRTPLK